MRMQFQGACVDLNQAACASSASVYLCPSAEKGAPGTANDWRQPWPNPIAMEFPRGCGGFRAVAAGADQCDGNPGDRRCDFALVAIARIDHFAENISAKMTEAVLSKVDLPERRAGEYPGTERGGPRTRYHPPGDQGTRTSGLSTREWRSSRSR